MTSRTTPRTMTAQPEILWTAAEAAAATAGTLTGRTGWAATGVSIDSRTVAPGDLFIALVGEVHDGHDHVHDALALGAAAAIIARQPGDLPLPAAGTVPTDAPCLVVADTFAALVALGRAARARSAARIVAVTGSVGKTSTKEALLALLGNQGKTHASLGNLNNQFGVPLSLARMPRDCAFAVFELGMNHAGEIAPLSRQVQPHAAIVTTVAPAHLEFFPSVAAIADEKAAIFDGLPADGVAILPADNDHCARMAAHARTLGLTRLVQFGSAEGADPRLIDYRGTADGGEATVQIDGRRLTYRIGAPGRHQAVNSLAVLAAIRALGGDVARAAADYAGIAAVKGRGARETLAVPGGTITLFYDSYTARPAAMRAALAVLGTVPKDAAHRRIAVLGDMRELGPTAPTLHADLAQPVLDAGIDLVFCVGPLMRALFDALPAPMRGGHADTAEALAPVVVGALRAGDTVTVKGSLGTRMAVIVTALRNQSEAVSQPMKAEGSA